MKKSRIRVLIMGASYGSLFAVKVLGAGHDTHLICRPSDADLINGEGVRVRLPVGAEGRIVEIDSRTLSGRLTAGPPTDVDLAGFDLVVLAMMEPQYVADGVRELLHAVAASRIPCLSIMNMPPPPFLHRIPRVDPEACRGAYTDTTVWEGFDPAAITMCSPDPQASRPAGGPPNVLEVRLATNFKAARFEGDAPTQILRDLEADIENARFDVGGGPMPLPVKLRVYESVFVPLAKWPMLIAGNYRCITRAGVRSIRDSVFADLETSLMLYEWVASLCRTLGAAASDLVSFERYTRAAELLVRPSAAARALYSGARNIERVDRLVQAIAVQHGMRSGALDDIVALIDGQLEENRTAHRE